MPISGPRSIVAAVAGANRSTSGLGQIHTATDGRDILINTPDGWEVDQPWLWWADDGGSGAPLAPGAWGNPPPGALGGPDSALALPAFMACTSLIAEQIAAMPWQVFRDSTKIQTPAWIDDPQNARLDGRSPGIDVEAVRLSRPEFWSQVITSMLWHGEAIIYTPRGSSGQILAPLWVLHPAYVEVDGGRYYVPDPDHPSDTERWEYLDDANLIVIRGHMRPGRVRGFGVLDAFWHDLRLAGAVREYATNAFQRGIPAGYLKVNAPDMTEAKANGLKQKWLAAHGGYSKSIAVLNAVTEFHPLDLNPQTIELINMLRLTVWEICTMFAVPPSKLGIALGDSLTYNNAQDDDARFVKDTLRVWVDRIETAVTNRLTQGTYMRVNLNSYLRGSTTDRYAAYAQALNPQSGWMTRDEVRALEDLPPLDGTRPATAPGTAPPGTETPPTAVAPADGPTDTPNGPTPTPDASEVTP